MSGSVTRSRLWLVLSILVVLMLTGLGYFIGPWTTSAMLIYIAMWLVFGGALVFIMSPTRCILYLRISAGVLGLLMTLSMIDFINTQLQTSGSIFQLRSPIAGFFIVALPAFSFAIWGGKSRIGKRLLEHGCAQQEQPESEESL